VAPIIEQLKRLVAPIPGVTVFFQPVQDIQISTRMSRAQFQYTLTGADANDVADWADRLAVQLQSSSVLRDVASEAQDDGLRMNIVVDRELAGVSACRCR
jgi:multidrug efflux pump